MGAIFANAIWPALFFRRHVGGYERARPGEWRRKSRNDSPARALTVGTFSPARKDFRPRVRSEVVDARAEEKKGDASREKPTLGEIDEKNILEKCGRRKVFTRRARRSCACTPATNCTRAFVSGSRWRMLATLLRWTPGEFFFLILLGNFWVLF